MHFNNINFYVYMEYERYKDLVEGKNYISHDRLESVETFCHKYKIPYSKDFVSIGCFVGEVPAENAIHLYGEVQLLLKKEAILPEIKIVVSDDFQNYVKSIINNESMNKERDISGILETCKRLNEGIEAKEEVIYNAVKSVSSSGKYAEARIFRRLNQSDVSKVIKE